MLRGIAVFSMRGRWQAAIAIALLSMGSLMLPPLSYLTGGVIALCTLRMGPKEGIKAVGATVVIFTLLAGVLLNDVAISGLFLISSWLPILGISLILGYTRSLAVSFLAAGGVGIVIVLGSYLLVPDPALWWQQLLAPFMEELVKQPGWQLDEAQMQDMLISLSKMMTGLVAAGLSMNIILGLLIGRAWQASLYTPGGFASEFQQLRLGKSAAMLMVALMVITALPTGDALAILRECLPVALVVFALQGLSVVHSIVKQQQKQSFWLVAIYMLLIVILPQMVVILAMIGVLEQWFNFRRLSTESGE